jgi:hypothetical protein
LLGDNNGVNAGEIDVRAPLTGAYTLVVTHSVFASAQVAAGAYAFTVVRTPGPYTITDEGGPATNGATHIGTIGVGDLDAYTIQASINDDIAIRIGEIAVGEVDPLFAPRIRLRGPDGDALGDSSGANAGEIEVRAPLTGLYTVLVTHSVFAGPQTAVGTYMLTLAKTPGPFTTSPGDEGGALINGATHLGVIKIGDLDAYTMTASRNDNIAIRIGEIVTGEVDPLFTPRIRLRGPDGAQLGDASGANAGEIEVRAPLTGVYTVLVAHSIFAGAQAGDGAYRLTMARTPGPYTISPTDEGGPIAMNSPRTGLIQVGDLDAYSFNATINDNLVVTIGENLGAGVDPVFTPRIRLRGPDGAPVGDNSGANAAEISAKAPLSGTYTVLVAHTIFGGAQLNTGSYTLTVTGGHDPTPCMTFDKTSLNFAATRSLVAFVQQTPPQTVRLVSSGVASGTWTATPTQPWITVTPSSGAGPAAVNIGVAYVPGLPLSGASTGAVTFTFTGSCTNPAPVTVGLATLLDGTSTAPYGVLDTPPDGSTGVTGSVAVTGWALDDLDVRTVRIVREPVTGEGSSLVFIGNATFIEGARPDVAATYPTAPRKGRGGWGYMLLTNFLPNGGNGTYRLHAMADDGEGHSTDLGVKVITCSNASATRPFGAIDTPAQGETIGGNSYVNFGWVLSRGPARADPPNGGSVQVLIDGIAVGSPVAWASRPDLTSLFPAATYPGVTNALGVFAIDTTQLTDGLHSIAWIVTSDTAQTDGVGSRFFTVANGSGPSLSTGPALAPALQRFAATALSSREAVDALPLDRGPLAARRGYDLDAPFGSAQVSPAGRATIQAEELDRVEIRLDGPARGEFIGFMRSTDGLAPLPTGSHLDPATGVFTWQPGAGFVHGYDLVFVRAVNGRPASRREVRVVLNPRGSNRVGPQVQIDLPAAQATVDQPFIVAGWALDRDDEAGTGISTLHAWAYPVEGGRPIFLGAAAYGGTRQDVGALFGSRFSDSGYGLTVDGLRPGTYDIAVFAWSTIDNGFLPARVVRVTVR